MSNRQEITLTFQQLNLDPDAVDLDIEIRTDDPIFSPDENEGERNIFDFIVNICNI